MYNFLLPKTNNNTILEYKFNENLEGTQNWVIFSSEHGGDSQLWAIDENGNNLQQISSEVGKIYFSPYTSPNGKNIIYQKGTFLGAGAGTSFGDTAIYEAEISLVGNTMSLINEQKLTLSSNYEADATYSIDGKKVILDREVALGDLAFIVLDLGTGTETTINLTDSNTATLSPDNTEFTYIGTGTGRDIFKHNADGSGVPTNINNEVGNEIIPRWRQSNYIYYADATLNEIYKILPDGTGKTSLGFNGSRIFVTYDESQVCYLDFSDNRKLYISNIDGSENTFLFEGNGTNNAPCFYTRKISDNSGNGLNLKRIGNTYNNTDFPYQPTNLYNTEIKNQAFRKDYQLGDFDSTSGQITALFTLLNDRDHTQTLFSIKDKFELKLLTHKIFYSSDKVTPSNNDVFSRSLEGNGDKLVFDSTTAGGFAIVIQDITKDGKYLLVNRNNSMLGIYDIENDTINYFNGQIDNSIYGKFNSDGTKLSYSGILSGEPRQDIYIADINLATATLSNITNLTNTGAEPNSVNDISPCWSLDDKEIVFMSQRDFATQNENIYKINLNTLVETQLTSNSAQETQPIWVNDNRILYIRNDGDFELYEMQSDGSSQVALTSNAYNDYALNYNQHQRYVCLHGNTGVGDDKVWLFDLKDDSITEIFSDPDINTSSAYPMVGKCYKYELLARFYNGTSWEEVVIDTDIQLGEVNKVVYQYNQNNLQKIFLNGEKLIEGAITTLNPSTEPLIIGSMFDGVNYKNSFNGLIQYFRWDNVLFTENQIKDEDISRKSPKSVVIQTIQPKISSNYNFNFLYDFRETNGTVLKDKSGNGYDANILYSPNFVSNSIYKNGVECLNGGGVDTGLIQVPASANLFNENQMAFFIVFKPNNNSIKKYIFSNAYNNIGSLDYGFEMYFETDNRMRFILIDSNTDRLELVGDTVINTTQPMFIGMSLNAVDKTIYFIFNGVEETFAYFPDPNPLDFNDYLTDIADIGKLTYNVLNDYVIGNKYGAGIDSVGCGEVYHFGQFNQHVQKTEMIQIANNLGFGI